MCKPGSTGVCLDMKRAVLSIAVILIASNAFAISSGRTSSDGFSLGPRYSNYSTDIDIGGAAELDSGRQHAFGLVGDYKSDRFVLDFMWDHDPENGIELLDFLPFELGKYERDRYEFTVGYALSPAFDVSVGARLDEITLGGAEFFGNDIFEGVGIEHQALVGGVGFRSTGSAYTIYGKGRVYMGSAKFDDFGIALKSDTTGFRAEGGVSIPIGNGPWRVVPGIEYEHIEAEDDIIALDTNRFFINFVYRFGGR